MNFDIKLLTWLLLIGIGPVVLRAQHQDERSWCNLNCEYTDADRKTADAIYKSMDEDEPMPKIEDMAMRRFPLRFGLVESSESLSSLSTEDIEQIVVKLNKAFAGAKIMFYLDRVDKIQTPIKLEDLSENSYNLYDSFSKEHDLDDMITVYVIDHKKEFCRVTPVSISCSRTGGFSHILSGRTNNIVMSRFDIRDEKIVAHEFGHFFGLYHTFEESIFGPDTFDPSTCHETGDRICDTPPDPGVVFEVYVNYTACEMIGLRDQRGNEYKPLLNNYMSYYKPCYQKEYSFTREQHMVMHLASDLDIRKRLSRG